MVFCPEHLKLDQNLKFTPLSETTSIPFPFIWEPLPPPPGLQGKILSSLPQKEIENNAYAIFGRGGGGGKQAAFWKRWK